MMIEDLKAVLSQQIYQKVIQVLTFDDKPADNLEVLYQQVPAGLRGKLMVRS